jgi:hypothetical protein
LTRGKERGVLTGRPSRSCWARRWPRAGREAEAEAEVEVEVVV